LEKLFTAYDGNEPYIFVCYAHEDSGIVYPEIQSQHEQGVNLWYDEGISDLRCLLKVSQISGARITVLVE
jgi:hypothetical protein